MKASWKAVWTLAAVVGMAGAGFAQSTSNESGQAPAPPNRMGHRHGMRAEPEGRLERLGRALNLTDDQKAKLKPIFENEWQEMKPIQQDTSLTRDQRREKMKSIHEKYREQIAGVLTPEQQQKWKQMQTDRMQRRWRMKGPGQGAPQN